MEIRRATISDIDAIFEFIKIAYDKPENKISERWDWLFVDNPYVEKDNLPIWIAIDDNGKVIGQSCIMIEPLKIGSNILMAGWGIDYKVLTSHEGLGIAPLLLISQWKESNSCIQMSLSMTQTSRRMNLKLGYIPIIDINYYILNISSDSLISYIKTKNLNRFIKDIIGLPFICKITSSIVNKWLSLRREIYADLKGLNFIPMENFGQEIDFLWDEISSEFDCTIVRNSEYLNWKYFNQPNVKYDIFLIKRKEKVVGYIVLRKNDTQGILVDFLFSTKKDEDIIGGINFAIKHFLMKGIYDIRVATSVNEYAKCIREIGVPWHGSKTTPIFFTDDPIIMNIARKGKWLFSYGDHDQQR